MFKTISRWIACVTLHMNKHTQAFFNSPFPNIVEVLSN